MGEDRGIELRGSDVRWSTGEIHLPQSLNEEASADEFSIWELVSSMAAERFAHRHMAPRPLSHTLPGFGCRQDMELLGVGDGVVVFWGGGCLRGFKDSVF